MDRNMLYPFWLTVLQFLARVIFQICKPTYTVSAKKRPQYSRHNFSQI